MYIHRYRKSICSERLVNYHSVIPFHEILNTYSSRVVTCSRLDRGLGFLKSYSMIINEMFYNSCPRRVIQQILMNAKNYDLGRREQHKQRWLSYLIKQIYFLPLGMLK